jgi:hypothetical protein
MNFLQQYYFARLVKVFYPKIPFTMSEYPTQPAPAQTPGQQQKVFDFMPPSTNSSTVSAPGPDRDQTTEQPAANQDASRRHALFQRWRAGVKDLVHRIHTPGAQTTSAVSIGAIRTLTEID